MLKCHWLQKTAGFGPPGQDAPAQRPYNEAVCSAAGSYTP